MRKLCPECEILSVTDAHRCPECDTTLVNVARGAVERTTPRPRRPVPRVLRKRRYSDMFGLAMRCDLSVEGVEGSVAAFAASFSSPPSSLGIRGSFSDGTFELKMRDGKTSFAEMANDCNAKVLIVGNDRLKPWPYEMTDSEDAFVNVSVESVVMIDFKAFSKLKAMMDSAAVLTLTAADVDNCAICLDSLSGDLLIAPCEHVFHDDCLARWVVTTPSCPCCRMRLEDSRKASPPDLSHWYS